MPTKTYLLLCPSARLVKIGKSVDPLQRMKNIQAMNAAELEPLLVFRIGEAWLHEKFDYLRHHGEWFTLHTDLVDYLEQVHEHEAAARIEQVLEAAFGPDLRMKDSPCGK